MKRLTFIAITVMSAAICAADNDLTNQQSVSIDDVTVDNFNAASAPALSGAFHIPYSQTTVSYAGADRFGTGTITITAADHFSIGSISITSNEQIAAEEAALSVPAGYVENVYFTQMVESVLKISPDAGSVTPVSASATFKDQDKISLIGAMEGADAAINLLQAGGVATTQPSTQPAAVPYFFSAVSVIGGQVNESSPATYQAIHSNVKVIRLGEVNDADVDAMTTYINTGGSKFVYIVGDDVFRPKIASLIQSTSPAAIIVGHYFNADNKPDKFTDLASLTETHRDVLRHLTTSPILLACSYVPYFLTEPPNNKWTAAFGATELTKFDGFAIYNIHNFALFTVTDRTAICTALGVPLNQPTIVLDFLGTRGNSIESKLAWQYKRDNFYAKLLADKWRGIVYLSIDGLLDANVKADMINSLPASEQFGQ